MNYEFECPKCKEKIEINFAVENRNNPVRCPACYNLMNRIISTCTFQLRGRGWAKDGYTNPVEVNNG